MYRKPLIFKGWSNKAQKKPSSRATAASRLYQAGVDKQLVMECTAYRELEGHPMSNTNVSQRF